MFKLIKGGLKILQILEISMVSSVLGDTEIAEIGNTAKELCQK